MFWTVHVVLLLIINYFCKKCTVTIGISHYIVTWSSCQSCILQAMVSETGRPAVWMFDSCFHGIAAMLPFGIYSVRNILHFNFVLCQNSLALTKFFFLNILTSPTTNRCTIKTYFIRNLMVLIWFCRCWCMKNK